MKSSTIEQFNYAHSKPKAVLTWDPAIHPISRQFNPDKVAVGTVAAAAFRAVIYHVSVNDYTTRTVTILLEKLPFIATPPKSAFVLLKRLLFTETIFCSKDFHFDFLLRSVFLNLKWNHVPVPHGWDVGSGSAPSDVVLFPLIGT